MSKKIDLYDSDGKYVGDGRLDHFGRPEPTEKKGWKEDLYDSHGNYAGDYYVDRHRNVAAPRNDVDFIGSAGGAGAEGCGIIILAILVIVFPLYILVILYRFARHGWRELGCLEKLAILLVYGYCCFTILLIITVLLFHYLSRNGNVSLLEMLEFAFSRPPEGKVSPLGLILSIIPPGVALSWGAFLSYLDAFRNSLSRP